jgi:hypothetical protein
LFWCSDGTGGGGLEKVQGDGGLAGGEGQGQAGLRAFSHLYNIILRENLSLKLSYRVSSCLNLVSDHTSSVQLNRAKIWI